MQNRSIRLGGAGKFAVYALAAFDDPPITGPWVSVWMSHPQGWTGDVPLSAPIDQIIAYFQNFISELSDAGRFFADPADTQFLLRLVREAYDRRAMGAEAANG
jgi:hypothetical protein